MAPIAVTALVPLGSTPILANLGATCENSAEAAAAAAATTVGSTPAATAAKLTLAGELLSLLPLLLLTKL